MTSSTHIPLAYDDHGIRIMQTGAERKFPCGKTVQIHLRQDIGQGIYPTPDDLRELLGRIDAAEVGRP